MLSGCNVISIVIYRIFDCGYSFFQAKKTIAEEVICFQYEKIPCRISRRPWRIRHCTKCYCCLFCWLFVYRVNFATINQNIDLDSFSLTFFVVFWRNFYSSKWFCINILWFNKLESTILASFNINQDRRQGEKENAKFYGYQP